MTDKEAIEMMQRCINEIKDLRREREALAPQVEAYRTITKIVNLIPQSGGVYGEDLIWRLEKKIRELKASEEANDD